MTSLRKAQSNSVLVTFDGWPQSHRYPVLRGDIQKRYRELLIQKCDSENVRILKGVVSEDHVHMHVKYPPRLSLSDLVKRLKDRGSSRLQPNIFSADSYFFVGEADSDSDMFFYYARLLSQQYFSISTGTALG